MGQYLSSPVTEKDTLEGSTDDLSYGISAHQGWRKNMEDAHIAHHISKDTYLFGIFDGHGGPEVAKFCSMYIREELERSGEFKAGEYEGSLVHVFHRMDDLMRSAEGFSQLESIRKSLDKASATEDEEGDDTYSMLRKLAGCTAVVALLKGRRLFVANAGDSRAVLARRGVAVPLSHDHKPSAAGERARIMAAGGFVSEVGGITRVNGNLNLSRAIGDLRYKANPALEAKDQIITAQPDLCVEALVPGDRFMVLACDGIWDVMSNQQVVDFVGARLDEGLTPTQAASELLNACVASDPRETRGIGCDNMTASVVVFKGLDEEGADFVTVDNEREESSTVLEVEIKDYPGLLRIIAWVLNGLDLVAENAVVSTDAEGIAHNTFWLTSLSGNKLKDKTAEMLADQVRDYLMYCTHQSDVKAATEFTSGPITISNSEDKEHSVIHVREDNPSPGFLLEVASALTGLNTQIQQGVIQGTGNCENKDTSLGCDARLFKFWVKSSTGEKLNYEQASALLFTLNVVLGNYLNPLTPPDAALEATNNTSTA
ncbi:putative protein phosphatase 2C 11 [Auxenochlorella protothecoides]|uniref:protein-serine/threonine phosphatase n=1 Tax=Auxenochlorella protothecoides TaxID=3075 RepID=A0A087SAX6_AUXPR|nr:putative protein phosphatase 2C 11 [Auxenochlorella protothecoides]KFM22880.1 putative protein phosphatase 2C 11 [Auxenochlorella protothecoides]